MNSIDTYLRLKISVVCRRIFNLKCKKNEFAIPESDLHFLSKILKLALNSTFSVQNNLLIVCAFHTDYFVVKTLKLKGSRIQRISKTYIFNTNE